MHHEPMHVETDVLIIGSGGAGMYAAIEAARRGLQCFFADRSLIGRGGATVMAQMTVAVALGPRRPITGAITTRIRSKPGADCVTSGSRSSSARKVPNASGKWTHGASAGHARTVISPQAFAPGHDRPRCVYVDFLNTGPAVSKTLRRVVKRTAGIRKAGDLLIVDLVHVDGEIAGAVALHLASGCPVTIAAKATILATGGLTRLYRRNSASANMGGDGYALALRAGVALIDMEFVQFFPDRPPCAAPHRHGSHHVGSVPLQARRAGCSTVRARNSPRVTA